MMDSERHKRVSGLVNDALDLPPEEREAFLVRECDGDPGLRREVDRLLAQVTPPGGVSPAVSHLDISAAFDNILGSGPPGPTPRRAAPEQIAGYRILHLLGEGGMGAVYLAEQEEPVARRVALKLIHTSLHTPEILDQFHAERNALARLAHPNVATLHEAGATEDGFPYFVMEHVPDGESLTQYCDRHQLGLEERLELFVQVCRGVQHAHQKGVLHRDLKPSNVLVTETEGVATVKVIDFGLAKSLDEIPLGERSQLTAGHAMGTPAYMSPEAIKADPDLDTRTDVYSLGVMLFELLVGERPAEPEGLDLLRVATGNGTTLPRPSKRVREATREAVNARRSSPEALERHLAGDLDWITLRAMAWDREERYTTASELADDVERFLRFQPVSVGPPTLTYQLRKFARRHRAGVAMTFVTLGLVLLGLAGVWQTRRSADRRTQLAAELNREVERIEWLKRVANQLPAETKGDHDREIVAAMARIEERLDTKTAGLASYALGRGELALGNPRNARRRLEAALEAGYRSPEAALALGWALSDLYDRRVDALRRVTDLDLREAALDQADRDLRQPALDLLRESDGAGWIAPELLEARVALQSGDYDRAVALGRQAVERLPWLYEARFVAGRALIRLAGETQEAERAEQLLEQAEREVERGLAVGRSDTEGHLLLCTLLSNRVNLTVRYSRPGFDAVRERTDRRCAAALRLDPEDLVPRLVQAETWHSLAEVQLWDRGEDPRPAVGRVVEVLDGISDAAPGDRSSEDARLASEAMRALGRALNTEAAYLYRIGEDPLPVSTRSVEHLERSIELDPSSADSLSRLSEVLAIRSEWLRNRGRDSSGELTRAIEAGREAVRLEPEMFSALYALGRALFSRAYTQSVRGSEVDSDLAEAEATFRRGQALDPDSLVIAGALGGTQILQAGRLRKRGEDSEPALRRAIETLEQGIARNPDAVFPTLQRSQAFLGLAWNELERGGDPTPHVAAARAGFLEGVESLPRIAGIWVELAEVAVVEARWALTQDRSPASAAEEALRHGARVLELDPQRADGHRMIALGHLVRALAGEEAEAERATDAARAEILRAIEMAPDAAANRIAFARLAWVASEARAQGEAPSAVSDLVRLGLEHAAEAERLDPSDAEATLLRGALLTLDAPSRPRGLELMAEARERNPRLVLDWRQAPKPLG